ncbi:sensor histidine kinase [Cytobacillus dafuensis]|uniref:histidine kinase n=1 Tax=Cytobacillus dafuensis TaxID=1742359 RepID=A0A5B8Z7P7_CYTDA|nr:HAMP domain-containing sensor histidine kinase [Cytobacillus dafuensis]QED48998.1 HAMP domain-containing histidine kinase [Cytobacillus dafuensis]
MKIKTWLMLSYFIVMILPVATLYFFYITISHYDEKHNFLEFMEMKKTIDAFESKLENPSLYKIQPIEKYEPIKKETDESMNITLYRYDGFKLYSTLDNIGFEMYLPQFRDELFQDLNVLKKNHRTFTYKKAVFDSNKLIGIYEIKMTRNDWLQGVNNRTLLLGSLFALSFIIIYIAVFILLNRKLNRPLKLLREEMTAFAHGEKSREQLVHANDELGELIHHFEKMKSQIEKTNAEVKRQQAEKEYMVASLSHDLKTPLTVIRAYSEALHGNQVLTNEEKIEYKTILFEKLDYMKSMLDDLALYTALQSAKDKVELVNVEGEEFFEMLLGGYHEPCMTKGIRLTVNQMITANYQLNTKQMMRIVDNLMENALRYTKDGHNIWLSALSTSSPLPKWIFAPFVKEVEMWRENGTIILIQNEGLAIPEENLEKVFQPFVQIEEARGQGGSSGLGLSIAKMAIEQHGGKIKLWSAKGYGTLVACWLKEG